ncbi:MTH938/NDUFAF3 family protein [Myxococcota bacterium]
MTNLLLALFVPYLVAGADPTPKPPDIVYVKFGVIKVDGKTYENDIVINKGKVERRKKGKSKDLKSKYGHTPLTPLEKTIPWNCKTLVIGTGKYGLLPIVDEFKEEAKKRGVKLVILKMKEAVKYYVDNFGPDINAIFHITC